MVTPTRIAQSEPLPIYGSDLRSQEGPDGAMLSRGLGWFSLALGTTELAIPRMLADAIGIESDRRASWVLRALGTREILHGLAILLRPRRPLPVWARVAGDALDVAVFGTAALTRRRRGGRVLAAAGMLAAAGALDLIASRRVQRAYDLSNRPVLAAVTINRPPREVYDYYRRLDQLPSFMEHLEEVRITGPRTSHWVARLPVRGTVEWDAEIIDDRPGELISWHSVEGSPIDVRGAVTFIKAPARDATEVRVEMQLGFRGKLPSAQLARIFAKSQVKGDLHRLKSVLETGEIIVSDASAHLLPHASQPGGVS